MNAGLGHGSATPSATRRHARTALLAALAAIAAFAVAAIAALPLDALLRDLSCDDSFYYGAIARELATTGRSSFDGVHETNGYHPLWCWLQVPVHWLTDAPETSLRLTRALEVLLTLVAAVVSLRTMWRGGMSVAASAWLAVFFVRNRALVLGMEAATAVLLLGLASLAAARYLRPDGPRRSAALLCGALLACVPLARLDQLAFSAFVTAWLLWAWRRRAARERDGAEVLLLVLPQVVVLGAYFTGNWLCFDAALPVSGMSKQLWSSHAPDEGFARFWRRLLGMLEARDVRDGLLFGALAVAVVGWRARRDAGWRALLPVVAGLWVQTIARTLYYARTVEPVLCDYPWYFTAGALSRYVAIALLLDVALQWRRMPTRWRTFAAVGVVAFALLQQGRALLRVREHTQRATPDWEMLSHDGCAWLRGHVPANGRVGAFDAGVLGYFAPQRVTNLDGLVQSRAFFEARRRGEPLAAFLREQRIDWIANVNTSLDELRRRGIGDEFVLAHEGERQRCVDGVERALFVLHRR